MPDPFEYQVLCKLAYQLWRERGCPAGSPEVDWQRAEQQLHAKARPARTTNLVSEHEMLDVTNDN